MVYVDPINLGYTPYWNKFVSKKKIIERSPLNTLFQKYVPVILDRIFEGNHGFEQFAPLKLIIPQTKLNMVNLLKAYITAVNRLRLYHICVCIQVTQLCFMLDAILLLNTSDVKDKLSEGSFVEANNTTESVTSSSVPLTDEMEAIFISALYCSLGAPLESDSRLVFDQFVKKICGLVKIDDSPSKRATLSKFNIIFFLSAFLVSRSLRYLIHKNTDHFCYTKLAKN